MKLSCLDSYAGTINRLRNQQLNDEKKVIVLCGSNFKSQNQIIETRAEGQAILHHGLPVHGMWKGRLMRVKEWFMVSIS